MSATAVKTVSGFLTEKMNDSIKTQRQIARECGYENANVISMFKTGDTKLPFTTIGPMAQALDVDPMVLLRLSLAEYAPKTFEAIEECFGIPLLSESERELILRVRAYSPEGTAKFHVVPSSRLSAMVLVGES